MSHRWYAIQAYSGSEVSVKKAIIALVEEQGIQDRLADIVVPMEDVIELKKGKQKIVERPLYPGYVFAKLDLDTNLWQKIQSLSRVGKFIGEAKNLRRYPIKILSLFLRKLIIKALQNRKSTFLLRRS